MNPKWIKIGGLVLVVGGVWGYILLTVLDVYTNNDPVLVTTSAKTNQGPAASQGDTQELALDYPDPFLKREAPRSRTSQTTTAARTSTPNRTTRVNTVRPVRPTKPTAPPVDWPEISYFGSMVNHSSSEKRGMIMVNGAEKLAIPGKVIAQGFRVQDLSEDSLIVVHEATEALRKYPVSR